MKHCGMQKCPICDKEVNIAQHKCYLQLIKQGKKKKKKQRKGMEVQQQLVFVYFDIEAQQDTGNHIANHIANLKRIEMMCNSLLKVKYVFNCSYNGSYYSQPRRCREGHGCSA